MEKYIKTTFKSFNLLNENILQNRYVVTIKTDKISDIDNIIIELEKIGCIIEQKYVFGVIIISYNGNINDIQIDSIASITKEKIANTY